MNEALPYIYGKLIKELENKTYTGKNTSSAITTVNNETNEISVDVNFDMIPTKEEVNTELEKLFRLLMVEIEKKQDRPV